MRIGELAAATGVDVETVRFYERDGLLPAPHRASNGYRVYGHKQLERLAFIRHCRALDIPLADVRQLLEFLDKPDKDCSDIDQLIAAQLLRVRARLKSMRALERQLTELLKTCDSHSAVSQCGILQELVSAAQGEACICHEITGRNAF